MKNNDYFYTDPLQWAMDHIPEDWNKEEIQQDPTQGDEIRTPWGGLVD